MVELGYTHEKMLARSRQVRALVCITVAATLLCVTIVFRKRDVPQPPIDAQSYRTEPVKDKSQTLMIFTVGELATEVGVEALRATIGVSSSCRKII
jgi:hypothetical protein